MSEWLDRFTQAAAWALSGLAAPVLIYFVAINTSYLVLVLLAARSFAHQARLRPTRRDDDTVASDLTPSISILVAAHNEAAGIVSSVRAMLALRYSDHEVIVVNDGSSDDTLALLRDAFDLVEVATVVPTDIVLTRPVRATFLPRHGDDKLTVVDIQNGGRANALNTALSHARGTLIAMVDADSILDPDALLAVSKPFIDNPDQLVATGGVIRAANGSRVVAGRVVDVRAPRGTLPRIQIVEYLRAFLLGRAGWSRLGALILISGAFGLFRRDVVADVGGLDPGTIGEDFELVMRIHRRLREDGQDYRVEFVGEPISWTEVPSTLAVLRRQRRRWHRGLWEVLWKYRRMTLNPRYGRVGMLALPYYWLFELVAPVIELLGVLIVPLGIALGVVSIPYAALFLALSYGYAVLVSLAAFAVDEVYFRRYKRWSDLPRLLSAAVWENCGYRQLTAVWRVEGWWSAVRGRRPEWGVMTRQGFSS